MTVEVAPNSHLYATTDLVDGHVGCAVLDLSDDPNKIEVYESRLKVFFYKSLLKKLKFISGLTHLLEQLLPALGGEEGEAEPEDLRRPPHQLHVDPPLELRGAHLGAAGLDRDAEGPPGVPVQGEVRPDRPLLLPVLLLLLLLEEEEEEVPVEPHPARGRGEGAPDVRVAGPDRHGGRLAGAVDGRQRGGEGGLVRLRQRQQRAPG